MMRAGDEVFVLHWRGGMKDQVVFGRDIAEAMNNAGIGHGALSALDYYEQLTGAQRDEAIARELGKQLA